MTARSTNKTSSPYDELNENQFWAPRMMWMANEHDVGTLGETGQQQTSRRISSLWDRYGQAAAPTGGADASLWPDGDRKVSTGHHGLFKRDQGHMSARRISPNAYRLTLEGMKRLIRIHQRQQHGSSLPPLTNAFLFPHGPLGSHLSYPDLQLQPSQAGIGGSSGLLIVPKRTDASADNGTPESDIRRAALADANTDGHQEESNAANTKLAAVGATTTAQTTTSTTTIPPAGSDENSDDSMQCNMRSFTYKATKTDSLGNQCTGLVMASICYGGCDTGEIADWLFPHKKSIHKVCRHGGRRRRKARLNACTSLAGNPVGPETLLSLSVYHYVDALNCVCKKCTSADTTCLGTMSRPRLQTLSEAVTEMGQWRQGQPETMTIVESDEGGD